MKHDDVDAELVSPSSVFPKKRLGQHFLHNPQTIARIVDALGPKPQETIIEIGPGTGALTSTLIERAGRVIAVEFDRSLIAGLLARFGNSRNFKLVNADALDTDFCEAISPAPSSRLVANLPYNISTAILQHLVTQRECLTEMVVMLQKEVVERILASPGSSERGYLSALIEAYCTSEKLFDVAPGAFRPPPKVWSSVVRLTFRSTLAFAREHERLFQLVVSAGFAQKRKTILNNLRNCTGELAVRVKSNGGASIVLCKAGIELQRRAESLTLEEWARIVNAFA